MRTGKTPQQQKHIHDRHTTLQQGKKNPAPASSHPVLQPFPAPVTDPLVRLAVQSDGGEGWGWGGECISLYVFMCVISRCLNNGGGTQVQCTSQG